MFGYSLQAFNASFSCCAMEGCPCLRRLAGKQIIIVGHKRTAQRIRESGLAASGLGFRVLGLEVLRPHPPSARTTHPEPTSGFWGYIGIMEKKMETTIIWSFIAGV